MVKNRQIAGALFRQIIQTWRRKTNYTMTPWSRQRKNWSHKKGTSLCLEHRFFDENQAILDSLLYLGKVTDSLQKSGAQKAGGSVPTPRDFATLRLRWRNRAALLFSESQRPVGGHPGPEGNRKLRQCVKTMMAAISEPAFERRSSWQNLFGPPGTCR